MAGIRSDRTARTKCGLAVAPTFVAYHEANCAGCLDKEVVELRTALAEARTIHDRLREAEYEQQCRSERAEYALAEAQRDLQEIRGVIGFPGSVALAEAGLTESLADVVRYTHRQWLTQTHNANQRVIRAEAAADAAQRENEELRADVVWAVRNGANAGYDGNSWPAIWHATSKPSMQTQHGEPVVSVEYDGTDADLCRAIREARCGARSESDE